MSRSVAALRIGVALGGGYLLTGVTVLALGALLALVGVPASQAVVVAAMTGFPVYLGILLWGLACASVPRLCGWTALWIMVLGGLYWALR